MNISVLIPGIVGAICGALGWLLVGLYMARRQYARVAKNAGRAVCFPATDGTAAMSTMRPDGSDVRPVAGTSRDNWASWGTAPTR